MTSIPLPEPDADTAFFWEATARHTLAILRCDGCGWFVHPPRPACRRCGGRRLTAQQVSGRGTVYSYTVTHRAVQGYEPPFTVALIELEEQPGLRVVSQVVDVPPEDVRIGMTVQVHLVPIAEGVWLPMFKRRP